MLEDCGWTDKPEAKRARCKGEPLYVNPLLRKTTGKRPADPVNNVKDNTICVVANSGVIHLRISVTRLWARRRFSQTWMGTTASNHRAMGMSVRAKME